MPQAKDIFHALLIKTSDNALQELKDTKNNLKVIIDAELRTVLHERFPNVAYGELVEQYGEEIERLRIQLYEKYSRRIESHEQLIYSIREG